MSFIKKYIKKILFLSIFGIFLIIFVLSNDKPVKIVFLEFNDEVKIWMLVIYSMALGIISTILFILPSIIGLKTRYKKLEKNFEELSDAKLKEALKDNDIIE